MATEQWNGAANGWATSTNWTPNSTPADGDTAIFDFLAAGSVAGSDQSATELAALLINSTFQSYAFGDNGTPVKVDATLCEIGRPSGSATAGQHSGRINLWLPDIASTILVHATKTSSTDTGKEPVRIKTGANANKITIKGTSLVGIATDSVGDTAQFSEIALVSSQAMVNIASGVTLTTLRQELGTSNLYGSLTTLQQDGGIVNMFGAGTITTAKIGGTANLNASGTITAMSVYAGGHADLSDSLAKTITTLTLYKGAKITYDPAVVTITNAIILSGCSTEDVTIIVPDGRTIVIA